MIGRRAAALAVVLTFIAATTTIATVPAPSRAVPAEAFTLLGPVSAVDEIQVPSSTAAVAADIAYGDPLEDRPPALSDRPAVNQPGALIRVQRKARPQPVRQPTAATTRAGTVRSVGSASSTGHRVGGSASWYCKTGVSACHHSYSGGMYAAAGGEIRIGGWRNRVVKVCGNGRCINVKLIDWCACGGPRIIDLYSDAFSRLAPLSAGVIRVTVSW